MKIKIEIEISNLKSESQNFGGKNRKLDKMVNLLQGTSENFEFFKLFSKGNKWRLLYYPDLNRLEIFDVLHNLLNITYELKVVY